MEIDDKDDECWMRRKKLSVRLQHVMKSVMNGRGKMKEGVTSFTRTFEELRSGVEEGVFLLLGPIKIIVAAVDTFDAGLIVLTSTFMRCQVLLWKNPRER